MKHCHECGQEFEDWVESCPDCGPQARLFDAPGTSSKDEPSSLPDSDWNDPLEQGGNEEPIQDSWRKIESFHEEEMEGIGVLLDEKGIPWQSKGKVILLQGSRGQRPRGILYTLFVPPEGFRAAVDHIRDFFGLGEAGESLEQECPSCQTPCPPGARECPECGLRLALGGHEALRGHPFLHFLEGHPPAGDSPENVGDLA